MIPTYRDVSCDRSLRVQGRHTHGHAHGHAHAQIGWTDKKPKLHFFPWNQAQNGYPLSQLTSNIPFAKQSISCLVRSRFTPQAPTQPVRMHLRPVPSGPKSLVGPRLSLFACWLHNALRRGTLLPRTRDSWPVSSPRCMMPASWPPAPYDWLLAYVPRINNSFASSPRSFCCPLILA